MSLGLDLALVFGAATAAGKAIRMQKKTTNAETIFFSSLGFGIIGALAGSGVGMGLQDARLFTLSVSMEDCIDLAKKNGSRAEVSSDANGVSCRFVVSPR